MDFFYKDTGSNINVLWETLIGDIQKADSYNPYCNPGSYYDVFKHLIISMLTGREIILLDADFTKAELIKLTGYSAFDEFSSPIERNEFTRPTSKKELVEKLKNTSKDWLITLFTSGTTGLPKKVSHTFSSIARFVKYSDKNLKSVWGYAYNPTHMAGVQVFLQALLNGNPIVRLFGLSQNIIHKEIHDNGITHISATPTFYRLLLPCDQTFFSVERITSGGEKFSKRTMRELSDIFPHAKIMNIYASTEAGTLFSSDGDIFTIKPEWEDLIKFVDNELFIHTSLMGNTDLNITEWYNTGDLVEILSEKPVRFRFISRKSEIINVGGYKVNSSEVEEAILAIPEIKEVRVFPKSNSVLGNIICCEIVSYDKGLDEAAIRKYLNTKIQEYKIPRIFYFTDEISTTRTGKIKRN